MNSCERNQPNICITTNAVSRVTNKRYYRNAKGDKYPEYMKGVLLWQLFGTDLSTYNGEVDFEALKRAGVRFAIVKATQGHSLTANYYMFVDSKFKRNVEGLSRVGIPVGA